MIIRKLYRFEAAHIVRRCTSKRCRENIHGHSYVAEVFISSDRPDRGNMVLDFALLDRVKSFIDCFDHSFLLWQEEEDSFKETIRKINERTVELPVIPSSEGIALLFFHFIDRIISGMSFTNGEGNVSLSSVRIHETATGYAEAFREDLQWVRIAPEDVRFSPGIEKEESYRKWQKI